MIKLISRLINEFATDRTLIPSIFRLASGQQGSWCTDFPNSTKIVAKPEFSNLEQQLSNSYAIFSPQLLCVSGPKLFQ
jgi:hypothetical protein